MDISLVAGASGDPASVCYPLPANQSASCASNARYVQAADRCLQRLNVEIQAYRAVLAKKMSANNAASVSAQNASVANNTENLAEMQNAQSRLLADATLARAELVLYQGSLTYPGPLSRDRVEELRLANVLSQFPCFSDNSAALTKDIGSLDKIIADLRKSSVETQRLMKTDSNYLDRAHTTGSNKIVRGRAPAGQPTHSSGTPVRNGAPTVTGDTTKDQKAAQIIDGL
jgi:hypothetical protein